MNKTMITNEEELAALLDDAAAVGDSKRLRDAATKHRKPSLDPFCRAALAFRASAIDERLAGRIDSALCYERASERQLQLVAKVGFSPFEVQS